MFEHFTTPAEIFIHRLGSALTMEQDSLDMLGGMEKAAMRSGVVDLFRDHAGETSQQIVNLEQCFTMLGKALHRAPSPATKGLAKEAKSSAGTVDNSLVDGVVLAGALELAHYETAAYETLITYARATDALDVVNLLAQNLEQERAAIERIKSAADAVARADAETQDSVTAHEIEAGSKPAVDVPPYLPPEFI